MAKPSIADHSWATDALFTGGDEIGEATKVVILAGIRSQGHVPGFGHLAGYVNTWTNDAGQTLDWVQDGSATMIEDAHIVETDANGFAIAAGAVFGPKNAGDHEGITATGKGTGSGVKGTGGDSSGDGGEFIAGATGGVGVRATASGTGIGLSASAASGFGILAFSGGTAISADAIGSAPTVSIGNSGTGLGLDVAGGTNKNAIKGTGNGTGAGLEGTGGASGGAGAILQGGAGGGVGAQCSGDGNGAGCQAVGNGTGAAVEAINVSSGPAVKANATGGTGASINLTPLSADPSVPVDGDMWGTDEERYRVREGGSNKTIMTSSGGHVRKMASDLSDGILGTLKVVAGSTLAITNDNDAPFGGAVTTDLTCEARVTGDVTGQVRVIRVAPGGGRTTLSAGATSFDFVDGVWRTIVLSQSDNLPAMTAGQQTQYEVEIQVGATKTIDVRRMSLEVRGAY